MPAMPKVISDLPRSDTLRKNWEEKNHWVVTGQWTTDPAVYLFRDEAGAAVHPVVGERFLQFRWLPGPVQHVRTGDMNEAKGPVALPRILQDVVQMIRAVDTERRVGVAW